MPASINDKARKVSDGSDYPNIARVSSPRAPGGTTLSCDDLTGWATDTAVDVTTFQLDTANELVSGSQTQWVGIVSGNNITSLTRVKGAADAGNSVNDVVKLIPGSDWADDLVANVLTHADQDGTLKAGAVDVAAVLADDVVETAKIKNSNVTTAKIADNAVTYAKVSTPIAFRVSTSSTSIPVTTFTKALFTVEEYDLSNNQSGSTFTVPADAGGIYSFNAAVVLSGTGSGNWGVIALYKNGTLVSRGSRATVGSTFDIQLQISTTLQLAATDTIELYVYQNSAGAKSLSGLATENYFEGYRVR